MKIVYTNQPLSAFQMVLLGDRHVTKSDVFSGKEIICSERFWKSLWKTCKVDEDLFKYFSSEEIFAKVVAKDGQRPYRFCLEEHESHLNLLGISLPGDGFVSLSSLIKTIQSEKVLEAGYHKGMIFSLNYLFETGHDQKTGSQKDPNWKKYDMTPLIMRLHPIDGLESGKQVFGALIDGNPIFFDASKISTKTKGADLKQAHFTEVTLKANMKPLSIEKACYSRLVSARFSAASLREISLFYRLCDKFSMPVEHYDEILSHPFEAYGLSSYNAFSPTRMSRLPTRNTVFDLLSLMSRAALEFPLEGKWKIYEMAGKIITTYYDFEENTFDRLTTGLDSEKSMAEENASKDELEVVDLSNLSASFRSTAKEENGKSQVFDLKKFAKEKAKAVADARKRN